MRLEELLKGNDVVQQHLAAERVAALLVVSPLARKAIEQEVIPQLESGISSISDVDNIVSSTKDEIESAFKTKSQVYTRLISYKSIDQSDNQYLTDLLRVLDEWATSTKNTLEGGSDGTDEVKVKIHVDSEVAVKVDKGTMTNVSVETEPKKEATVEQREDIPVSSSDEGLDLNEMRL